MKETEGKNNGGNEGKKEWLSTESNFGSLTLRHSVLYAMTDEGIAGPVFYNGLRRTLPKVSIDKLLFFMFLLIMNF